MDELIQTKEQKNEPIMYLELNVWVQIALKAVAVGDARDGDAVLA